MKTLRIMLALSVAVAGFAAGQSSIHGDPYVPVGSLRVFPAYVPVGAKPDMVWSIRYPEALTDIVDITADSSLITKRAVRMRIRVVGVAFQSGRVHLPVALWTRIGGGAWDEIFVGKFNQVDPERYLVDMRLDENTRIDFAGRGSSRSGNWGDLRITGTSDVGVVGLANGDMPPSYVPAYDQGSIESFLTSYMGKNNNGHGNNIDGVDVSNPGAGDGGPNGEVDLSGDVDDEAKRISLGPHEMIYLFELGTRDTTRSYFDMQDLVMVLTFADEPAPQPPVEVP